MAVVNKNLDTIIAQAIHGPKVDSIPLYARIDGQQEIGFRKVEGGKSEKWEKACIRTFTSPTNIRKVFISGHKVVVQLYKPIMLKGKPDTNGCWREFKLDDDNNLYKIAMDSLNYNQNLSRYYMEKNINKDAKEPDRIVIKGTGLKALSHPWVASNVEEVYFDWTLLVSETYLNSGLGCNEILRDYLNGKRGFIKNDLALNMFVLANGLDVKDIRNRFPRLRCVGLISELGKILDMDFDRGKPGIDNLEDWKKLWILREKNIELIKQSKSLMMVNELNDVSELNTNFSLRTGIYKFDRDILSPFVDDLTRRVNEYLKGLRKVQKEESTQKSKLEILLDEIVAQNGEVEAKKVLLLALSGCKMDEIDKVFEEMSPEGAKKYRVWIGK